MVDTLIKSSDIIRIIKDQHKYYLDSATVFKAEGTGGRFMLNTMEQKADALNILLQKITVKQEELSDATLQNM